MRKLFSGRFAVQLGRSTGSAPLSRISPRPRWRQTLSKVAGVEPGQRQLNGPQTTGREYRNLSTPAHGMRSDQDVAAVMRDGVELLADVHRPEDDGRFPVLISASPYPRQIQDLGAPMGFIEAGASDFWVPRGYVHDREPAGNGGFGRDVRLLGRPGAS